MCDIDSCGNPADLPPIELSPDQRRRFLKGLAGLPLATVLAFADLRRAVAATTETVTMTTSDGREVSAALALPDAARAPAVLLIHEWWGLNDQILSVAAEFARQGYVALAVDLYGGQSASDATGARALMQAVDAGEAAGTLGHWISYLRDHPRGSGTVGTVGWCFGGSWSLNASLSTPVDATVIYYGDVSKSADQLRQLDGPVLAHFATRDGWITGDMVAGFERAMADAGKADALTVHWYEADHAFANPTSARYDAEDAAASWQRTLEFFGENL